MRAARRPTVAALACAVAAVAAACVGTTDGQVEVVAPEPEPQAAPTTRPPDCAELLPPAAQAGQLVMVMVTTPELAADAVAAGTVAGFGLKGRQSSQVDEQIAEVVSDAPVAPLVAGDEEGGSVQRLSAALGELPAAADLAAMDPAEATAVVTEYAEGMAELGVDLNFAPVADVGGGSGLGDRSFGDDVQEVASMVELVVEAQQDAGVDSVVKHWPGIGTGVVDPHDGLGSVDPVGELRDAEMVVFDRAVAAGAPAVMVGHVEVPDLTAPGEPASLSRAAITDELRGRRGFDGVVVTDSLAMDAVADDLTQAEAAERAVAAGADLALIEAGDAVPEVHEQLTDAIVSGRIDADQVVRSVRRVLALKGIEGQCLDLVAAFSSAATSTSTTAPEG